MNCLGFPLSASAAADEAGAVRAASCCCFDCLFSDVTLGPYSFATVSVIADAGAEEAPLAAAAAAASPPDATRERVVIHRDCVDSNLQAFHRDAVPLFLPYHTDLDSVSWWSPQAILFHYTSACLPGNRKRRPRALLSPVRRRAR